MKAALLVLLVACGDPQSKVDASIQIIDAPKPVDAPKPIDAAVDAPPDATPMNITTACTNICTALGVCFMAPVEQECITECSEDLFDCSAQQVMDVDGCSTQPCGDIKAEMSPMIDCLVAITCIDPATGNNSSFINLRK